MNFQKIGSFFRGAIFLILFSICGGEVSAQHYYYFDLNYTSPDSVTTVNYQYFLGLNSDGSTLCRVRYLDPLSQEDRLVKIELLDTLGSIRNDSIRFLVSDQKPGFIIGSVDGKFFIPGVSFLKIKDSLETYYEPAAILSKNNNGTWDSVSIQSRISFSSDDILMHLDVVNAFFDKNDPFLNYLLFTNGKGLNSKQLKTKLYLIAVANTKDASIGVSTKKDLDKITSNFDLISRKAGIQYIPKVFAGNNFFKIDIEKYIKSLRPGSNDIVIFYYSGHGFRFSDDLSPYPRISLRTTFIQDLAINNLVLEDIYNSLLKKKAKVTMVLGDCCNENIGRINPVGFSLLRPRSTNEGGIRFNTDNFIKLFMPDKRLSILVGSAEKNQLSVGNPELGGFYTNFFLAELMKNLFDNNESPSWINMLSIARNNTLNQARTAICGSGRCVQRAVMSVVPPF